MPITDTIRAELVAAAAATHGLTAADYVGLAPGMTYYGYDADSRTYWAAGALVANPKSYQAGVSTQDDGSYTDFRSADGQQWKAFNEGGIGATPCDLQIPPAILAAWQWAPGSCAPPQR